MEWIVLILTSTVVSAGVSFLSNWVTQNKQIHAEIVSKARHQWIQEIRALLSEYVTEVMTVNQEIDNRNSELFIGEFLSPSEIGERVDKINTLCNKIILYFGEVKVVDDNDIIDEQNESFNGKVIELKDRIANLNKKFLYKEKVRQISPYLDTDITSLASEINNKVNNLIKESSKYLKTEWYKTKNSK